MKNGHQVSRACRSFDVLMHTGVLDIVNYVAKHEPVSVGNIYRALKVEQSHTSQKLKNLRQAKLVTVERRGKYIFYSINYKQFEKLETALSHVTGIVRKKKPKEKPIGIIDANHLEKWT